MQLLQVCNKGISLIWQYQEHTLYLTVTNMGPNDVSDWLDLLHLTYRGSEVVISWTR